MAVTIYDVTYLKDAAEIEHDRLQYVLSEHLVNINELPF